MAQNSGKKGGKPTPQQQEEELEETLQEQVNRLSADLTGHKGAAHKLSCTLATYGERLKLLEDSRTDTVDPAIRTLRGDVAEIRAFTHGSSSRHDEQERQLADVEAAIKELSDKGHPVPGALAHLLESLTDTLGAIRQATPQLRAPPAPTIDLAHDTDQQEQQEKAREELRQLSEQQRLSNQRKRELERSLGQNSEEPPRSPQRLAPSNMHSPAQHGSVDPAHAAPPAHTDGARMPQQLQQHQHQQQQPTSPAAQHRHADAQQEGDGSLGHNATPPPANPSTHATPSSAPLPRSAVAGLQAVTSQSMEGRLTRNIEQLRRSTDQELETLRTLIDAYRSAIDAYQDQQQREHAATRMEVENFKRYVLSRLDAVRTDLAQLKDAFSNSRTSLSHQHMAELLASAHEKLLTELRQELVALGTHLSTQQVPDLTDPAVEQEEADLLQMYQQQCEQREQQARELAELRERQAAQTASAPPPAAAPIPALTPAPMPATSFPPPMPTPAPNPYAFASAPMAPVSAQHFLPQSYAAVAQPTDIASTSSAPASRPPRDPRLNPPRGGGGGRGRGGTVMFPGGRGFPPSQPPPSAEHPTKRQRNNRLQAAPAELTRTNQEQSEQLAAFRAQQGN